jgi:hypothetical protein
MVWTREAAKQRQRPNDSEALWATDD